MLASAVRKGLEAAGVKIVTLTEMKLVEPATSFRLVEVVSARPTYAGDHRRHGCARHGPCDALGCGRISDGARVALAREGQGGRAGASNPGTARRRCAASDNAGAARAGDIVVIAVPFSSHDAILDEISDAVAGKIVVDAVVPLVPPRVSLVQLPPRAPPHRSRTSASATRRLSCRHFTMSRPRSCGRRRRRLRCAWYSEMTARPRRVIALADAIGTRGIDGGPIANSVAAEALTSILIGINRRYKVDGAGTPDHRQHRQFGKVPRRGDRRTRP